MQISPLNSQNIQAADIGLERLVGSTKVSETDKIAEAGRAFEALLLRNILSESQKPVFSSKYNQDSSINSIYRDVVVNQMAENISKSGTFGLAKNLTDDLSRQIHPTTQRTLSERLPEAGGKMKDHTHLQQLNHS